MELLKHLSIGKKFALIAITILIGASLMVVVTIKALAKLGKSSDRGWQRLAASQQIALASYLRDTLGTTISQAVNAPQGDTLAAQKRQKEIPAQATQLRGALEQGKPLLNAESASSIPSP